MKYFIFLPGIILSIYTSLLHHHIICPTSKRGVVLYIIYIVQVNYQSNLPSPRNLMIRSL